MLTERDQQKCCLPAPEGMDAAADGPQCHKALGGEAHSSPVTARMLRWPWVPWCVPVAGDGMVPGGAWELRGHSPRSESGDRDPGLRHQAHSSLAFETLMPATVHVDGEGSMLPRGSPAASQMAQKAQPSRGPLRPQASCIPGKNMSVEKPGLWKRGIRDEVNPLSLQMEGGRTAGGPPLGGAAVSSRWHPGLRCAVRSVLLRLETPESLEVGLAPAQNARAPRPLGLASLCSRLTREEGAPATEALPDPGQAPPSRPLHLEHPPVPGPAEEQRVERGTMPWFSRCFGTLLGTVLGRPGTEVQPWLPVSLQTACAGSFWKVPGLCRPHRSGHSDVLGAHVGPREQAAPGIIRTTRDWLQLGKVVTPFLRSRGHGSRGQQKHGLLRVWCIPRYVTPEQTVGFSAATGLGT